MVKATFRFYEELNDFLPGHRRKKDFEVVFKGRRSVKDKPDSDILFEVSEYSSSSMTQEDGSLVGSVDLTMDEEGSFTEEGGDFSYVTMIVMATRMVRLLTQ